MKITHRRRILAATTALLGATLLTSCLSQDPDATGSSNDDTAQVGQGEVVEGIDPIKVTWAGTLPEGGLNTPFEWWADEVTRRSGGAIEIERFYSGSLITSDQMVEAVSSNRVQIGHGTPAFNPADFPLWSVSGIPFQGDNPPAEAATFWSLYQDNDLFKAEMDKAGLVLALPGAVPATASGFKEPFENLDELSGQRIRVVGYMAAAFEELGMSAVPTDSAELYGAIQQGVVDAYGAFPMDLLVQFGLHEVTHTYDLGVGQYSPNGTIASKEWWDSLQPEARDLMIEVAEEYVFEHQLEGTVAQEDNACTAILEDGNGLTALTDEQIDELRTKVGDASIDQWVSDTVGTGLTEDEAVAFRAEWQSTFDAYDDGEFSAYENGLRRCAESQ